MTFAPGTEEPEENATRVFTKDPVRVVWVVYGIVQAAVVILMAAELVTARLASVITGLALIAYVAVSELYVRKETVPLNPPETIEERATSQINSKTTDTAL